jgi:hypothetical protein
MANISTYPIGTPAAGDLVPGTQNGVEQADGSTLNLTRNFTVQSLAAFANSYSLGYTVYTAQMDAAAGAEPVVVELQNTTGLKFVWTRLTTGQYGATVAGTPFAANKFWGIIGAKILQDVSVLRITDNTVRVDVAGTTTGVAVDGLAAGYIEIRIYS